MSRPVVVVESGQGDRVGNVELLARTVDTPYFNLAEVVLRPGEGVPGHVHQAEDDSWLVLDGTLSVTVGEEARRVEAGPGTFVLVPAGTTHELRNDGSTDVRFLNVHAPGGFDRRIGWRPRRRATALATVLAAVLATVLATAGLLVAAGGPASAAGLTRAKVQGIAASVVARQAPTLSVARAERAALADRATVADRAAVAEDATALAGQRPAAYLDRVAYARGPMTTHIHGAWVPLTSPLTITVPEGVGYVRATGVASFGAHSEQYGSGALTAVRGTTCAAEMNPPQGTGGSRSGASTVMVDRVVAVDSGPQTFVLCGYATVLSFATGPTLILETVAGGAS